MNFRLWNNHLTTMKEREKMIDERLIKRLERKAGGEKEAAQSCGVTAKQWRNWKNKPLVKDYLIMGIEAKIRSVLKKPGKEIET